MHGPYDGVPYAEREVDRWRDLGIFGSRVDVDGDPDRRLLGLVGRRP